MTKTRSTHLGDGAEAEAVAAASTSEGQALRTRARQAADGARHADGARTSDLIVAEPFEVSEEVMENLGMSRDADGIPATRAERAERIRMPRWIGYTRALEVLADLEELFVRPRDRRMPKLLLLGDPNNGKTTIIDRFYDRHLPYDNPDANGVTLPVLRIAAPPVPNKSRFYETILDQLFSFYGPGDRVEQKRARATRLLAELDTRMLVIEDFDRLLAGTLARQRHVLSEIETFADDLRISVVAVGGSAESSAAAAPDSHLAARRFEPVPLPRWTLDAEYLRLLATFERALPHDDTRPGLTEPAVAEKILAMTAGSLGEISALLVPPRRRQGGHAPIDASDYAPPSEERAR